MSPSSRRRWPKGFYVDPVTSKSRTLGTAATRVRRKGETVTDDESGVPQMLMTYVDSAQTEWTEVEPGYRVKVLVRPGEARTRMVLVHYDAGYQLSRVDQHSHDEYLYVLSGTFVDQNQASGPGTLIHNRPGSFHQPSSPDGCTFLAVTVRNDDPHQSVPEPSPI